MKKSLLLLAGVGIWQARASVAQAVLTPEQRADPSTGQIPNSSPIAQEYYLGQIGIGQSTTGAIVGAVAPDKASLSWYKFVSDGTTPITFDMYGTNMSFGVNGFGASNDGELAVYDNSGNFIACNKGSASPANDDSNVPSVIPVGAPTPPVRYRQPLDPTQPVYTYRPSGSSGTWYAENYQGLANLSFVKSPQANPLWSPSNPNYNPYANWNQYSILPAGTYFIAVTAYSTYFSGNPGDASSFSNDPNSSTYEYAGGDTSTTPFGFLTYHAFSGTYQVNARIAGDFNGDGIANLSDLRLLRLQVAQYLPTAGIASAGYQGGTTWVGLPTDTSSPLTDLQQYDMTGNSRIDQNDIQAYGRYTGQSTTVSLTWNNTAAQSGTDPYNPGIAGDGITWDLETSQNFNDTVGTDVYFDGDLVTFNDANNGNYDVTLNSNVSPGSLTIDNSAGNYTISGTGSIAGTTSLLKLGTSKLTLSTVNTYTGGTNVSAGTLAVTVTGAIPVNSALMIGPGAIVIAVNHGTGPKVVLQTSSLSIVGSINSWTGLLDLTNNDLIAHNASLSQITNQIKSGASNGSWQGSAGITSSTAAADIAHLTALGVIQNSITGSPSATALFTTFDGSPVTSTDILVKYTYFGDANLDGKIDGSDYARIDSGYLSRATGWFNGDFNYDGAVNGSDYTLIDNAFNRQGAQSTAAVANPTSLIASNSSVPEPGCLAAVLLTLPVLARRKRR